MNGISTSRCSGRQKRPDQRAQDGPAGTDWSRTTRARPPPWPRAGCATRAREPAHGGVGVGVALEQRLDDRRGRTRPERGAAGRHPPGEVDVVRRRLVEQGEVLGGGGDAARVRRAGPVLGVARPAHGGRTSASGRAARRPVDGRVDWPAIRRRALRNGSTTPGAVLGLEHAEDAGRTASSLESSPLSSMSQAVATASARDDGVGQRAGAARAGCAATGSSVRDRGEGEVGVVERAAGRPSGRRRPAVAAPAVATATSATCRSPPNAVVGAAVGSRCRGGADAASSPSGPGGRARRRRAARGCRCRRGRARPRSSADRSRPAAAPIADIRSSSAGVAPGVVAEVGAQALDERLLADVRHELLEDALRPWRR